MERTVDHGPRQILHSLRTQRRASPEDRRRHPHPISFDVGRLADCNPVLPETLPHLPNRRP